MKTLRGKAVAALGLGLLGIWPPRSADADPSIAEKATATQLFKEGRALLEQGQVGPACRKLEESQRLDPGGGTLLNLALCHEREGRAATAWVEFTDALGIAKKDNRLQRAEFARAHLAQLEPTLSRLVVEVSSAADSPDLEIKRDGSILARAAWGSPIPIDPGDHVVEAAAAGKIAWRQSVVIGQKPDTKTLIVPSLEDAPAHDDASTSPPATQSQAHDSRATAAGASVFPASGTRDETPASSGGANAAAWLVLGLGAAATGVGTYFALHAISLKDDADRNCPNDACSAQGAAQNGDAIKSANYATVGFGVGIVGLGLGAVLFATHSTPHPTSAAHPARTTIALRTADVSVGPGSGEVTLSGQW